MISRVILLVSEQTMISRVIMLVSEPNNDIKGNSASK